MSSPTDGAIIVGFLTLLGVVLTPIFIGYFNRLQQRELSRHSHIDHIVKRLIELRARLQFFQIALHDLIKIIEDKNLPSGETWSLARERMHGEEYKEMELAFGEAYAIMLSVDVESVREAAPKVMKSQYAHEKLEAIDFALKTLGEQYNFFDKKNSSL